MNDQIVLMAIEPAKKLSKLCGFPYFIEKRFSVSELLKQGVIDDSDIVEMKQGKQICKSLKVAR